MTTSPAPTGPPTSVELATPEAAAVAWMARWCPITAGDGFGAAEARARAAMTDFGWEGFIPTKDPRARASWQATVDAGETAECALPQAFVPPAAPATPSQVVVQILTTRVVRARSGAVYAEELAQLRHAVRGVDGLWRIDVAAGGG